MTLRRIFPWKIFRRVVLLQVALIVLALGALGISARFFFERQSVLGFEDELKDTLQALSNNVPQVVSDEWCVEHARGTSLRINVISSADGKVICDSHFKSDELFKSRAERPEVIEALKNGYGTSLRESQTLQNEVMYSALYIPSRGMVLRVGFPLARLTRSMRTFDRSLALAIALILLISTGATAWIFRHVLSPVGRILSKMLSLEEKDFESLAEDRSASASRSFGEFTELEATLEKITRDRQLEVAEQAAIMGTIPDAILAIDLNKAPLFFNSNFVSIFGEPESVLENDKITPLFLNLFNDYEKAEAESVFTSCIDCIVSGESKYFDVSIATLKNFELKIYGAVAIFHDVTLLKRNEKMRTDFVANASHELRTPLTSIKGFSDTILQHIDQGKGVDRSFVETISRNSNRLLSLVNSLLELSILDAGADELQKVEIEVKEITNRVIRQLEPKLIEKSQRCIFESNVEKVKADTASLEQILINLLDNAYKYSPRGTEIKIRWENNDDIEVLLRVSDNGAGISAEHHSRLFERFYRVDKARSRKVGGSGIGLSIVKHIMQRHGGSISVESELGKGTTFICRFPNVE